MRGSEANCPHIVEMSGSTRSLAVARMVMKFRAGGHPLRFGFFLSSNDILELVVNIKGTVLIVGVNIKNFVEIDDRLACAVTRSTIIQFMNTGFQGLHIFLF